MFKAQIKLAVLKNLDRNNYSGYELMKDIGACFGKKPSPGYIYPLLKDLKNKEFIREVKSGNKIIYSITKTGRLFYRELIKKRDENINSMIKAFKPLADKDEMKLFADFIRKIKDKNSVLSKELPLMEELKEEILKVVSSNYTNKREKFRFIISSAIKELNKLNAK